MKIEYPKLYKQFFVNKEDERLELFRTLSNEFKIKKGLYPGSFVHITPSLIIEEMVYVDVDRRCKAFFEAPETKDFLFRNKQYEAEPIYRFYEIDYNETLNETLKSFDFLISLYAGFISKSCRRYLKAGGILLANNSHGDAPLAYLDKGYDFVGVINRKGNIFDFRNDDLISYFVLKPGKKWDSQEIERTMKGPAYQKSAYAYVFRKK